ncbi:hypothetical protein VNO80_17104 [Phaseolus coccineus]|uniref:Uncharacterized protein n=1 Tax=Phaseolus coccineus TaxID=3886 RepID=A0AAN9MSU5_PHACN
MSLAMFLKQIHFTVLHLGPAIFVSISKSKSFLFFVGVEGIDGPLHPVSYNVNLVFIPVSKFEKYPIFNLR